MFVIKVNIFYLLLLFRLTKTFKHAFGHEAKGCGSLPVSHVSLWSFAIKFNYLMPIIF